MLCQHLRKVDVIEPFQEGFDPTNLTAFFGVLARKGTKTGQDKSDRCEGKEHCWKGRFGAVRLLKHPNPTTVKIETFIKK